MIVVGGCDAGGTKTVVRILQLNEQHHVVATGQAAAGPGNVLVDQAVAVANISEATRLALADAGLAQDARIDQFVAAVAGAGRATQQTAACEAIHSNVRVDRLEVVPDAEVLFEAAEVEYGVALVSGTGSIAWARTREGDLIRAGGLGPLLGDEGSGYWLGVEAVKITAQRLQTFAPRTPLMDSVLAALGVSELADLVTTVYSWSSPRPHFAGLATAVTSNVGSDALADQLLQRAADKLAALVTQAFVSVADRASHERVPWVCAGGLLVNCAPLRSLIAVQTAAAQLDLTPPLLVAAPVDGALKRARARIFDASA